MAVTEIKLKIHEESDMFSPFDPDQEMLSEDLSEYLSHCYKNKKTSTRRSKKTLLSM